MFSTQKKQLQKLLLRIRTIIFLFILYHCNEICLDQVSSTPFFKDFSETFVSNLRLVQAIANFRYYSILSFQSFILFFFPRLFPAICSKLLNQSMQLSQYSRHLPCSSQRKNINFQLYISPFLAAQNMLHCVSTQHYSIGNSFIKFQPISIFEYFVECILIRAFRITLFIASSLKLTEICPMYYKI